MPNKVTQTYIETFDLPDDHKHTKYVEACRALKALGCTEVRESRHYDIKSDGLKMTIIGYVLEV